MTQAPIIGGLSNASWTGLEKSMVFVSTKSGVKSAAFSVWVDGRRVTCLFDKDGWRPWTVSFVGPGGRVWPGGILGVWPPTDFLAEVIFQRFWRRLSERKKAEWN